MKIEHARTLVAAKKIKESYEGMYDVFKAIFDYAKEGYSSYDTNQTLSEGLVESLREEGYRVRTDKSGHHTIYW